MTATFQRRNRMLARLAICAAGGLIAGGVIAIPFSGHDDTVAVVAPSTAPGPTAAGATGTTGASGTSGISGPSGTALGAGSTTVVPNTTIATGTDAPLATTSAGTSPASGATTTASAPSAPPTPDPTADPTIPEVEAAAYVLIDADTGATLAASNSTEHHTVGSIMKLLTAYVVMQAGDPTKVVTVPQLDLAVGESRIYLSAGQHFQRDLLLRAMLIVSAGDAAEALAIDIAGSQEAFVEKMNAAAQSLGMNDTNAANADGLDADDGYSTAADVAKLARVLMQDATFRDTVSRTSANLFKKSFPATNTLLGSYDGATGIKTGHTTDAGYCLTASATRNGRSLIAVVIGTPSKQARDAAAAAVLDWGFAQPG
ncbi:MAG: D-alanyl-D-alanine carboxypeptidase family protein [Ilumatobacteraceae bacterium]